MIETLDASSHLSVSYIFLWIAIILLAAKIGSLVEKIGQPAVLGELLAGVLLGNFYLLGVHIFEPIKENSVISFLAELGLVIMLFQIGLESNLDKMRKVGIRAFLVAVIGVVVPFLLGFYVVGPLLFPNLSLNVYIFLGASLTATSVGITARIFQDLGKTKLPFSQIVLGAAVLDDIIGLIILASLSALVTAGALSFGVISSIVAKALFFLIGAIVLGHFSAPFLGRLFSKINTGIGMKFVLAVSFGLVFSWLAERQFGLAPIAGAFAAGLVLDPVHFSFFRDPRVLEDFRKFTVEGTTLNLKKRIEKVIKHHSERHIEDLIEPLAHFFVPIFFVLMGMSVQLTVLLNQQIILASLLITVVAVLGKVVSGIAAGKGSRLIVGFGMVPRGEVGLIFAAMGSSLGILSADLFSVIVIMVIMTTLLVPSVIAFLLKRQSPDFNLQTQ